jgi:hypothetical protein
MIIRPTEESYEKICEIIANIKVSKEAAVISLIMLFAVFILAILLLIISA